MIFWQVGCHVFARCELKKLVLQAAAAAPPLGFPQQLGQLADVLAKAVTHSAGHGLTAWHQPCNHTKPGAAVGSAQVLPAFDNEWSLCRVRVWQFRGPRMTQADMQYLGGTVVAVELGCAAVEPTGPGIAPSLFLCHQALLAAAIVKSGRSFVTCINDTT